MQKLMTQLKKNDGYISIETILVAGLIIVLGIVLILKFSGSTKEVTNSSAAAIHAIGDEHAKEIKNNLSKEAQANYDNKFKELEGQN